IRRGKNELAALPETLPDSGDKSPGIEEGFNDFQRHYGVKLRPKQAGQVVIDGRHLKSNVGTQPSRVSDSRLLRSDSDYIKSAVLKLVRKESIPTPGVEHSASGWQGRQLPKHGRPEVFIRPVGFLGAVSGAVQVLLRHGIHFRSRVVARDFKGAE